MAKIIETTSDYPQHAIISFEPDEYSDSFFGNVEEMEFNDTWLTIKQIFNLPNNASLESFFIKKVLMGETAYFYIPISALNHYIELLIQNGIQVDRIH